LNEGAKRFYRLDENGEKYYPYREMRVWRIQLAKDNRSGTKLIQDFFKTSMARRTFITILRRNGFGFEEVRCFTDHQNPIVYIRYSRIYELDQRIILGQSFGKLSDWDSGDAVSPHISLVTLTLALINVLI